MTKKSATPSMKAALGSLQEVRNLEGDDVVPGAINHELVRNLLPRSTQKDPRPLLTDLQNLPFDPATGADDVAQ